MHPLLLRQPSKSPDFRKKADFKSAFFIPCSHSASDQDSLLDTTESIVPIRIQLNSRLNRSQMLVPGDVLFFLARLPARVEIQSRTRRTDYCGSAQDRLP